MILQLKIETKPEVYIHKPLDMFEDFEVKYNHQFEDYNSLSGRKIPYTNKFKIPTTKNNRLLCGLPIDANYPVSREVDGRMYYSNGLIAFDFVATIEGQQIHTLQPYIEISIMDVISKALADLSKWKMSDLFEEESKPDRRYIDLDVDTWVYGDDYQNNNDVDKMLVFPYYNFNNKNASFAYDPMRKLTQLQPTFVVNKLIKNIFSYVGLNVASDFLNLDNQLAEGIKANELGFMIPSRLKTSDNYDLSMDIEFAGHGLQSQVATERTKGVPAAISTSSRFNPVNFITYDMIGESLKFNYDYLTEPSSDPTTWDGAREGSWCSMVDGEVNLNIKANSDAEDIFSYLGNMYIDENDEDINRLFRPTRLLNGTDWGNLDIRVVICEEMEETTYYNRSDFYHTETGVNYNYNESEIIGQAVFVGFEEKPSEHSSGELFGVKYRLDFVDEVDYKIKVESNRSIKLGFILTAKKDEEFIHRYVGSADQSPEDEYIFETEITDGYIKNTLVAQSNINGFKDDDFVKMISVHTMTERGSTYPLNITASFEEATDMPSGVTLRVPAPLLNAGDTHEVVVSPAKVDMVETMKSVKDYKLIEVVKMIAERFNLKFYSTSDGVIHLDSDRNRISDEFKHIDHLIDDSVDIEFTDNEVGIVNIKDTNPSFYEEDFNRLDNLIVSKVKREEVNLTFKTSVVNSKMFKDSYDDSGFDLLAVNPNSNYWGIADRSQSRPSDFKPTFLFLQEGDAPIFFPVNRNATSTYNDDIEFDGDQLDAGFYNTFKDSGLKQLLKATNIHENLFDLVSFEDDEVKAGLNNLYTQTWFQNIMDRINDQSVIASPSIYVSEETLKVLMDFPTLIYKGQYWEYLGLNGFPLTGKNGGMAKISLIKKHDWEKEIPPTIPTNLYIYNRTSDALYFSWTPSADNREVVSYNIYLDGVYTHSRDTIATASIHSDLEPSTEYLVGVSAVDNDGNEGDMATVLGTTLADENEDSNPTVPDSFRVSSVTTESITVFWNHSVDDLGIDSYDLKIDGVFAGSVNGDETYYTYTGLTPSTSYQLSISSNDTNGNNSGDSDEITGITDGVQETTYSPFLMTPTGSFGSTEACDSNETMNTYYHTGNGQYPSSGDYVYNDSSGVNEFKGDSEWFKTEDMSSIQIDFDGHVFSKLFCQN